MTKLTLVLLVVGIIVFLMFFTWTFFRTRITKTEFFMSNLLVLFIGMAGGGMLQSQGTSWLWWILATIIVFFVIVALTVRNVKKMWPFGGFS